MKLKIIKEVIKKNFGLGNTSSDKLHRKLGLNSRKSPAYILSKHSKTIQLFYSQRVINNDLKRNTDMCIETRKIIQPIKIKVLSSKQNKKNDKK